jgi:hypothetical protein
MRTSGTGSETGMTVAIALIAVAFLVILAGGPSEFMLAVERTLEAVAGTVYHAYRNVRG